MSNPITNGIGPDVEQTDCVSIDAHSALYAVWMEHVISNKLRNVDGFTSDRFEFTHAAMIELEDNRDYNACKNCKSGDCEFTHHNDGRTWFQGTWTPASYASTDHLYGK